MNRSLNRNLYLNLDRNLDLNRALGRQSHAALSVKTGDGITTESKLKIKIAITRIRRQGFTLIELMVVIVLIGIVSAAILPAMRGTYEDALLRSTGRELINVFELAYSRAVSLNQVQRVRISEETGRYVLEEQGGATTGNDFLPVRDVPGSEGTLDSRIAISIQLGNSEEESEQSVEPQPQIAPAAGADAGRGSVLTFYPDGTADAREVRLQDRDGFKLALRINPVTARVRIVELARD